VGAGSPAAALTQGGMMAISTKAFLRSLWRTKHLQLGIATLLGSHRGKVFSLVEIADWLYCEREDGGPEGADVAIRSAVFRLRLAGCPIVCHERRGYSIAPRGSSYARPDRWARMNAEGFSP
jgi:hypothetical protein